MTWESASLWFSFLKTYFFSLSLSLIAFFLWTGCLFPIDWISSGPSFYVCNYNLLFHELGGCFSSTEFPQDLVFMSLINSGLLFHELGGCFPSIHFLAFYVFSSWLLFDDLGVLLHYSHPCVSFPHAASFPLFLLSPQVAMFPSVLGQHTHHCTAVTTAPLTTSLLLILINRIKFLSQYSPALNAGRMPRTQPVRKLLHLCVPQTGWRQKTDNIFKSRNYSRPAMAHPAWQRWGDDRWHCHTIPQHLVARWADA